MSETSGNFMDGLRTAARDNPLAAALIGGGALWLLIGNDRLKRAARSAGIAAAPVADLAARGQHAVASTVEAGYDAIRDRTSRAQEEISQGTREAARSTRTAASETVTETLKGRFDEGVATAQETWQGLTGTLPGKEVLTQAASSLADLFERQPLVLGAVGIAIGATVAGALANSDLEDELVGEFSNGLKSDLAARADNISRSAREAGDTLKSEFADAGMEYIDRIKQAGRGAIDAASEKLK